MQSLIQSLEELARAAKMAESAKIKDAIRSAQTQAQALKAKAAKDLGEALGKLESELSIWQEKADVILKEPVGRQGMSRHAHHWAEELKKFK